MRYRIFRSHGGKLYFVRLSDDEIRTMYSNFAGYAATTLAFIVVMVVASGIF